MSHERVKRGWVWNQFFVVEEYTGTEPLYVGKVRCILVHSAFFLNTTLTHVCLFELSDVLLR